MEKNILRNDISHGLNRLLAQVLMLGIFLTLSSAKVCKQDNYDCSHQIGAPCSAQRQDGYCYPMEGSEWVPSEPGGLEVMYFIENGTVGLVVSWEFPDDASVCMLTGFAVQVLTMDGPNVNKRECFHVNLPDISKVNTSPTAPAKIFIDCFRSIEDDTLYQVSVTSLPTPNPPHPHKSVIESINITKLFNVSHDQCTWHSTVSWKADGASLNMTARVGPPDFLREIYIFSLYKCNTDQCNPNMVTAIGEKEKAKKQAVKSHVSVVFESLKPGKYLLQLVMKCDKFNDTCQTKCKHKEEPTQYFEPEIKNGQSTTTSLLLPSMDTVTRRKRSTNPRSQHNFSCKPPLTSTQETTATQPESDTPTSAPVTTHSPNAGLVVGLTLTAIAVTAVALAVVILSVCRKENSPRLKDEWPCWIIKKPRQSPGESPGSGESPGPGESPGSGESPGTGEPPGPGKPLVLIINSFDFAAHEECVIALAQFLHKNASCEVSHYRIGLKAATNKFNWLRKEMEKASKVLILHSVGSKLEYHGVDDTWSTDAPPEGDIFKRAFDHIISKYSKDPDHHRFLNARFSYSPPDCIINDIFGQANHYVLMNHIQDLVAIIHGIPLHSEKESLDTEILHPDRYHKAGGGNELKSAIEKATQYIQERPHLFPSNTPSEDSGNISMLSSNNSSSLGSRQQLSPLKQSNPCSNDIFGEMESPKKSLTEASELFQPIFPISGNFDPREHDESGPKFIPPFYDSDESAEGDIRNPAERLWDINFKQSDA